MMTEGVTHLPVISEEGRLAGIVTAWDVSKAVALKYSIGGDNDKRCCHHRTRRSN